jgi:predicted lipoprotein
MRDLADFYLEHFIKGSKSQDIPGDLDRVFNGTGSLSKNSSKGITAMEYTLFGHQESLSDLAAKMNTERLAAAVTIAGTIATNLKSVRDYYLDDTSFLENNDEAISALLNVLVDNVYKLKEIRIGDPAGYTAGYLDDPDSTRLEYYKSLYSLDAVKAILAAHKSIMDNGLSDIAEAGNAASEAEAIVAVIDEAIAICDSYEGPLEHNLDTLETEALYNAANLLQNNYTALINALNFTQDIIEADGD